MKTFKRIINIFSRSILAATILLISSPAPSSTTAASASSVTKENQASIMSSQIEFSQFSTLAPQASSVNRTNGENAEPYLLMDLSPGTYGGDPQNMVNVSGTLFFTAKPGYDAMRDATGLWKSDGTASGTTQVKEATDTFGSPDQLINVDGTLFFTTKKGDSSYGARCVLWKSDGTESGTLQIKDFSTEVCDYLYNLVSVNGVLFFYAYDKVHGYELWKSDGTIDGTVMVKDIYPGIHGSAVFTGLQSAWPNLVNFNDTLFFTANDGLHGNELWKSDGSESGTVMVKNITSDESGGAIPQELTNVNGTLFFELAYRDYYAAELWKSDGTADGTVMIRDGFGDELRLQHLTNASGTLFFSALTGAFSQYDTGYELWKSDGSTSGTMMVKDIYPSYGDSSPQYLTDVNGTLFFTAEEEEIGRNLWKSDGSSTGTMMVAELESTSLINANGTLFFVSGGHLWKSNGTPDGTTMVTSDVSPALGGGRSIVINDTLFFYGSSSEYGGELWAYDISPHLDPDAPTVLSITRADSNPVNAPSPEELDFIVKFSEPVLGVSVSDFRLSHEHINNVSITDVQGFGDTHTITVSRGEIESGYFSEGTIHLDLIDNDTIWDFEGNELGGEGLYNGDYLDGESYIVKFPPLIIVHGWQGFGDGFSCSGIDFYENGVVSTLAGRTEFPEWFKNQGYQVWFAHWETSLDGTPSLIKNAECLQKQLVEVATRNPEDITIVAHSMGGVLSRAALHYNNRELTHSVKSLYTLGSPHAGIYRHETAIRAIGGLPGSLFLRKQVAVADMAENYMEDFNSWFFNLPDTSYTFIGGKYDWGWKSESLLIEKLSGLGPNDGLVGQHSAVGWKYDQAIFEPSIWAAFSPPTQYWTDEVHSSHYSGDENDDKYAYYESRPGDLYGNNWSHAFQCILGSLGAIYLDNDICIDPSSPTTVANQPNIEAASTTASEISKVETGSLSDGEYISVPVQVDTAGETYFNLSWISGDFELTLTRPDAQIIDPTYAMANPSEVSYEDWAGSPESAPSKGYYFSNAMAGEWQLNITATSAGDYWAYAMLTSGYTLSAEIDQDSYAMGDTATLTATIEKDSVGLSGQTVTATLTNQDGTVATLTLTDQGDGTYTNTYLIPNIPGYLQISVDADGNDAGTLFTRHTGLQVTIHPEDAIFTEAYSQSGNDANADGLYEIFNSGAEVNVSKAGDYALSADLYSLSGEFITHAGDFLTLASGTQMVTLSFDGTDIRKSGFDGPYTLQNLMLIPTDLGLVTDIKNDVLGFHFFNYTEFGICYPLTLSHSGNGTAPTPAPANSTGCAAGEYVEGETINLTTNPDSGWEINSWSGTDDDNSNMSTNIVTMPASSHTVTVIYTENKPTIDDFVITVKTDNAGTSSDTEFTIPTYSGETYNYNVDCDNDGTNEVTGATGDYTCSYASAGTYTIRIKDNTGISTGFPRIYFNDSGDKEKLLTIIQWGTGKWTSMENAFYGCENLAGETPSDTPDLSNLTNMAWMFRRASAFNQDISNWNTTNVISMWGMFDYATSFNQAIGNWDTSNVKNMAFMFGNTEAFNQNIGSWDVSNVEAMDCMFYNTSNFNQDISSWDTSRVEYMFGMFWGAAAFNQDINAWNTSNVTDMSRMFKNASAFNQNIGNWDVGSLVYADNIFEGIILSTNNYDALLNGWNAQNLQPNVSFDGGNSTYCAGEAARTNMVSSDGWTITDGGKDCPSPPINDDIDNAIDIALHDTINLDTRYATSIGNEPTLPTQCGINGSGQATVWYTYYLASDDAISINTIGSDYDTFIAIWEGTDINDLRFVACNDDSGGTKQSSVAIRVTGGKTYYIEVGQP